MPNIEVRPSVEEVQKMLCQVNLFKSGSIHEKLTLFKRGKHLHKIKTSQVGQTILSVCKGVAQWKGVGKQTKQQVHQEVVKELARTVGMSFKFSNIFNINFRKNTYIYLEFIKDAFNGAFLIAHTTNVTRVNV